MIYYDSHCHINDEKLLPDVEQVVLEAKEAGVSCLLVIGWDLASSKEAIALANRFEGVYAAIGYHPENLDDVSEEGIKEIEALAKNEPKVIAIGEIGLDYHWFKEAEHRQKQKVWFVRQIEMANRLRLPISIHAREAAQDTYDVLKEHTPEFGGVLHCYSSSKEMMARFHGLGLYFGFDGPITFKNAIEPKECVKACDEERILAETDSPYLAPVPFRGKINTPKYIPNIVQEMANLRGVSLETMANQLLRNFEKLFRVKL